MTTPAPKRSSETTESGSLLSQLDALDTTLARLEARLDEQLTPVRQQLHRRFPTFFLLAVTFGVTATFFGMEQLLLQSQLLSDYPWLILGLGLGTLVLTGTLYRKLG